MQLTFSEQPRNPRGALERREHDSYPRITFLPHVCDSLNAFRRAHRQTPAPWLSVTRK